MKRLCALLSLLGAVTAQAQSLEDIHWVTEEYAPYNFTENGELKGISVEIIEQMWARLDAPHSRADIDVLPWARAYHMAQTQPGTCLFSTTVTASRRELFNFVEPLVDTRVVVLAPVSAGLEAETAADLDALDVGVVREDIGELLMQEAGTQARLRRTDSARSLVRMLEGGRFDAIAYSHDTIIWNMQQEGLPLTDYEVIHTLEDGVVGISCQPDTDPELLQTLQRTLDAMHEDGTVERIAADYLS